MSQVFRGGIPYQVDVNRLKEAFPVPSLNEGRVITHAELEEIVQVPRATQRYYGVVNSWIGQMKHSNGIFMIWEPSVGLKILDPAGVLGFAETRTKQKIRQTGKAVKHFSWVDRARLDNTGQQRLDHQMRVASAIKDALHTAAKDLAIKLAPVKSIREKTGS